MLAWQLQFQNDVDPVYLLIALAITGSVMGWYALRLWMGGGAEGRQAACCAVVALAALAVVVAGAAHAAFRHPGWLTPTALLIFVATVILSYQSVYRLGHGRIISVMALRIISVTIVLLLLVRPVISNPAQAGPRPTIALLLDASQSMGIRDIPNAPTRFERAVSALRAVAPRIEDTFELRPYAFDAALHAVSDVSELRRRAPPLSAAKTGIGSRTRTDAGDNSQTNNRGESLSTDLATAIAGVAAEADTRDIRAIVLLSDGNHNAGSDPLASADAARPPVYTVVVGQTLEADERPPDIAVSAVDAPHETAANNVCKIKCRIDVFGLSRRMLRVRLMDGRRVIATREVVVSEREQSLSIEFEYVPRKIGRKTLTVEVPVDPDEVIPQNNRQAVHVLVTEPRIKLLYIEGAARAEFKYLRRYLSQDPQVELATLVQTRIGHFQAGGSVGGRPMSGWPRTRETIGLFDVFLIGDVDRSLLSNQQLNLLHDAVSAGKGLIVIGGQNSFGPGGYAGSKLEAMLPVVVGGRTLPNGESRQEATPFVPQLTAEGRAHPILTGIVELLQHGARDAAPAAAPSSRPRVPPLRGCVIVDGLKPAALLLAQHPTRPGVDGKPLPVLAVQTFGRGRTAAFMADTTYLWYLARQVGSPESLFHRFWGQMIRWLAGAELGDRRTRLPVRLRLARATYKPGERVEIRARVLNAEGQAENFADVEVEIKMPDGQTESLRLERVGGESGRYAASITAAHAGEHVVTATARKNGKRIGADELPFAVEAPLAELQSIGANRKMLEDIARAGGGRFIELVALHELLTSLRAARRLELRRLNPSVEWRLFDIGPALFIVFLVLVTTEWILRRRWQLQ